MEKDKAFEEKYCRNCKNREKCLEGLLDDKPCPVDEIEEYIASQ